MVTAAELLSVAAFLEGKHAQAFPSFGPERTGAPVVAYCRVDARPIRTHEPVVVPDAVVVQDATLLSHHVALFDGLAKTGFVLLNSARPLVELGVGPLVEGLPAAHTRAIAASDLARAELGRPLPNAAMLGGFSALTGVVGLDAVVAAIESRFHGRARSGNVAAARAAFAAVGTATATAAGGSRC